MSYKLQMIKISNLLLDQANARLGREQPNQQATQVALAKRMGADLIEMAEDIINNGTDPTNLSVATPEGAPPRKYRIIEGNRRLLTLKALETPAIVDAALTVGRRKKLAQLSEMFHEGPIDSIQCVVYDLEEEARHWIVLRHTGANKGVGVVQWGTDDQDRYKSRHNASGDRGAAGQVLDFVDQVAPHDDGAGRRVFTTLQRLIFSPKVRTALGIDIESGIVFSHFPKDEVIKGLGAVVRDLRSGTIKVTHVYYDDDRTAYIEAFTSDRLPDPSTRLAEPVRLRDLLVDPPLGVGRGSDSGNDLVAPTSHPAVDTAVPAPRHPSVEDAALVTSAIPAPGDTAASEADAELTITGGTAGSEVLADLGGDPATSASAVGPAPGVSAGGQVALGDLAGPATSAGPSGGTAASSGATSATSTASAPAVGASGSASASGIASTASGLGASASSGGAGKSRVKPPRPRLTTIPNTCQLWIKHPRINAIYHELIRMEVDRFTNACSVLLRVFVELTVDHHIDQHSLMTPQQKNNTSLAKKIKELSAHLKNLGVIPDAIERVMVKIADGNGALGTSTVTFNQYVHNPHVYPAAADIRTSWDEIQPFMTAVWKK